MTAWATVGGASPVSAGAALLGPAPMTGPVQLDVILKPRDPGALERFASTVSTPGNPRYRHFLPRGRLAQAFGPTAAAVARVRAALADAGLVPGPISANGLLIPVTTTVGGAESAFHTHISAYRLATGRTALAPTSAPRLPAAAAADVQSVIGLNTTIQQRPESLSAPVRVARSPHRASSTAVRSASAPSPCYAATSAANQGNSYTGAQIATAYDFGALYDAGDTGSGATVALFELEPFKATDVASFQACYFTHTPVAVIPVDHGAGTGAGSGEAALDIENVIELAPSASIDVYEAPNTAKGVIDNYTAIASADTAQVVSTSWGLCEALNGPSMTSESTVFEEMAAQGQTVFAASGDSGSEDCLPRNGFTIPTGKTPDAAVADPSTGSVYVADKGGDVTVESESALARVQATPAGGTPDGVALDPVSHDVYVADATSPGAVSVIAGATCHNGDTSNCVATTIPGLGNGPDGIAVDPSAHTVYVANKGSGTLSVIAESSDSVVATVALGARSAPVGVAVDATSHRVYVTDSGSGVVSVIDGATCDAASQSGCATTPPTVAIGGGPDAVVVNPGTAAVYVADTVDNQVSVIDGSTLTITATVATPGTPGGLSLSPNDGQLLVPTTNGGQSVVEVISTATDAETTFIATSSSPGPIAVDPASGYAFLVDGSAGTPGTGNLGVLPLFLNVDDPGSQPYVTDVGGTDLTQWSTGPVESAWGDQLSTPSIPIGAGGGGISSVFAMPSYQSGIVDGQSSAAPCGVPAPLVCREVPDVSASADPNNGYVIVYNGFWESIGGTSGAAPLWAALAALTVALNGTAARLGNVNPDLYLFASKGYPVLNDITVGDNDFTTTNNGAYAAGAGYDMATGLGTPQAANLAAALNPFVVTSQPTDQTVANGQTANFTVAATGSPTPTFQWLISVDGGSTFSTVPGATAATYSLVATAADSGEEFEAVVSSPLSTLTTPPATLDVFAIATQTLPDATRGVSYRVQLVAAGGAAPYRWSHHGKLPNGLTLSAKGVLAGTPKLTHTKPGLYGVTVTATTKTSKGHPALTTDQALVLNLL